MTQLFSLVVCDPKAQTQCEPPGTWNFEKLHLELKYLGKKLADAKLQQTELVKKMRNLKSS